ncbi:MAG TPA: AglZ/HisF2 family acetamidino modification protein [Anaerolineae bacterium]|nr:AglZ/HisF2 family acetamidino modification protein [Anaerolineae bacterium]
MLRPRIIPCLLIKNGGLVKTVQFDNPKYVGDPINAVRIFNEKEVDELIIADIDATVHNCEPDYNMIRNIAMECRMPLCYTGGVKTLEQVEQIISLGVEKIGISSASVDTPELITESTRRVGSQSVVVVIDVRKVGLPYHYEIFTHNGTQKTGLDPVQFVKSAEALGAGEILINSIDHDGKMQGYDLDLVDQVRNVVNLPLSLLGGAGSLGDIEDLIRRYGIIGAAAGSLFVFKGKYHAVLINYPSRNEKENLCYRGMYTK